MMPYRIKVVNINFKCSKMLSLTGNNIAKSVFGIALYAKWNRDISAKVANTAMILIVFNFIYSPIILYEISKKLS